MKKSTLLTLLIGALPFLMVLANSMLIPLLPQYEGELKLSSHEASLILSMFSVPAALIIPFAGFLSDRYGRKRVILVCMAVIAAGGLLCSFSAIFQGRLAYQVLLSGRFIQGLGTGGTTPLAMALIGDLFYGEERSRQLGLLEGFNGIAKVLAPIAGALFGLISWYAPFFIFPVLAFAAGLGFYLLIKNAETGREDHRLSVYLKNIGAAVKREKGWRFAAFLYGGAGLFLLYGLLYFLAYTIEETFHIDGFFKGFAFAFPLGSLTIASYWAGKRMKTSAHLMQRYLAAGSVLLLLSFALLAMIHSFSFLMFFLTVGFGGLGLVLPCLNSFVTSSTADSERGFVVGLYGTARFLGVALGPILFSVMMENPSSMFVICMAILTAVQAVFWISYYRRAIGHFFKKAAKRRAYD
ncbi:MFS transporter [Metabacillus sp. GX 13764]|uniref:MFS transporter n=1 Tax=Metabacillus kandeliae TaxID=2900151 RepID=UPI001E526287|nr:MFS transporter [Metabacillus kandeliae]